MEKSYFDRQKSEILGKIKEAAVLGDAQTIYTYSRIFLNLETEYKRGLSQGNRFHTIDFSIS